MKCDRNLEYHVINSDSEARNVLNGSVGKHRLPIHAIASALNEQRLSGLIMLAMVIQNTDNDRICNRYCSSIELSR